MSANNKKIKELRRENDQLRNMLIDESNDTVRAVIEISVITYDASNILIDNSKSSVDIFTKSDCVSLLETLTDRCYYETNYALKSYLNKL